MIKIIVKNLNLYLKNVNVLYINIKIKNGVSSTILN